METLDIGGWVRRVHAPTKQEDRTSDGKKGGKRKRRENEKKNEEREIVEHRVEGSILHSAVREKRS